MASNTTIHIGELVSSSGLFSYEGTSSVITALSDSTTTTSLVIAPRQAPTWRFRLNAAELAQIPDGLVTEVSLVADVIFDQVYESVTFPNGQVVQANVPQYPYLRANLETFNLGRSEEQPTGLSTGPAVKGIALDDLQYGILTVTLDTFQCEGNVRLRTLNLRILTNTPPTVTAGGYIFGGDRPTVFFGFSDPEGQSLEAFRAYLFSDDQFEAAGFDPNTATPRQFSGTKYSSTPSYEFEPVEINKKYRAFFVASEVGSNNRFTKITAAGPYVEFTVVADPGPIPTVKALRQSNPARVELLATAPINLLSEAAGNTRSALHPFAPNYTTNGNLSRQESLSGTKRNMELDSLSGVTFGNDGPAKVTPGRFYSANIRCYRTDNATNNPRAFLELVFYNAVGTEIARFGAPGSYLLQKAKGQTNVHTGGLTAPQNAATVKVCMKKDGTGTVPISITSVNLIEAMTLNLLANPLLDHGDATTLDSWVPWQAGPNTGTKSRSFTDPLIAGTRSTKISMGAITAAHGYEQLIEVPAGFAGYGFAAVVKANKNATIVLSHPQMGSPAGFGVTANQPVLFGKVIAASVEPSLSGSTAPLRILTDTPNCEITIGWIGLWPAVDTDIARWVPELLNDWSPGEGGKENQPFYRIERSLDNGATWTAVRGISSEHARNSLGVYEADGHRATYWNDFEAPNTDDLVMYRARTVRLTTDYIPNKVPSPPSLQTLVAGSSSEDSGTYLIPLSDPDKAMKLSISLPFETTRKKQSSIKQPIEGLPVVHYGGITGFDGVFNVDLVNKEEFDLLSSIDALQETLLLKRFDGGVQYVDLYGDFSPTQDADEHWTVSVPFVETVAPINEE